MARAKQRRRSRDGKSSLFEAAVWAAGTGAFIVLLPAFLTHPGLRSGVLALRGLGWFAVLIGLMLFGFYRWMMKADCALSSASSKDPQKPPTSSQRSAFEDRPWTDVRVADVGGVEPQASAENASEGIAPSTPARWSALAFDVIEWRRFEAVCERLFAQAGFETRSQSHGADGGVDIWLHSKNAAAGPVAVVQCKHWRSKPVGVADVRQLLGSMTASKVARGIFATTSSFTGDAKELAKQNSIQLLDRAGLLDVIAKRTPQQQQELLDVATAGEFWIPTCASCGAKMVRRLRRKSATGFWGCANFPRCRSIVNR